MVLNSKIEVRVSAISGRGLYAKERITKGETLWEAEPDESKWFYTMEQIKAWPEEEQKHFMNNAYLVKPGTYSGVPMGHESDKGEFMNHSCAPNCLFQGDELCIAGRDIEVDEEVTYDYATSETPESTHMPFHCRCGTALCRGDITGEDCIKPAIRELYKGHFTTLAMAYQAEHDAKASHAPAGAGAASAPETAVAATA